MFVSININQFASRSASPESLYSYIVKGFGPTAGFALDMSQLTGQGVNAGGVASGLVLALFGFSGLESATSLGDEPKKPLSDCN